MPERRWRTHRGAAPRTSDRARGYQPRPFDRQDRDARSRQRPPARAERQVRGHRGAFGLWQDHAALGDRVARRADERQLSSLRRAHPEPFVARAGRGEGARAPLPEPAPRRAAAVGRGRARGRHRAALVARGRADGGISTRATAISRGRPRRAASAKICSIGSTPSSSGSRRCASAARTSSSCRSSSSSRRARALGSRTACIRTPSSACSSTAGPATCASSRTPMNGPQGHLAQRHAAWGLVAPLGLA
jgi:hypothetical protein